MLTVTQLRCEYADNPLGIDTPTPRLSWVVESSHRGAVQTAYRILVADTEAELAAGHGNIWDSGKITSAASSHIEYAGCPLQSRGRYYWSVQVWDNHGEVAQSEVPAWFEVAFLDEAEWISTWIGCPCRYSGRSLMLRHIFHVEKPVVRARIYAAGLGYYELRLNGQKVGDAVLEPAPTTYEKRVLYTTHDVTELLRQGDNALDVVLGNGWYGIPKLSMQAEITYADGSETRFYGGGSEEAATDWLARLSPILTNDIYAGEDYDARLEPPDWAGYDPDIAESVRYSHGWIATQLVSSPGGRMTSAAIAEPIKVVDTFQPLSLAQPKPDVFVFDMGRNFAGWVRIRVQGASGDRIQMKFAETLYDDGTVNQENLRTDRVMDSYILKGQGIEEWEPRLTYHGFRYVQVEGWPGEPTLASLDGRAVRTAANSRGSFACDVEILNQIHRAVVQTEASNLHGIPTDCPQREERMGWLNDVTARAEEAIHNFDLARLYSKWLNDFADAQNPVTGGVPDTVPHHYGSNPADPVCIAYLLLPWLVYQHYGDYRLLQRHYRGMKAWVDCLISHSENGVLPLSYYGDWAPPMIGEQANAPSPVNVTTPGKLVSTGFLHFHAKLLATIAATLGEHLDHEHYTAIADRVAEAFNREFWDEPAGGYGRNNQSANALALYIGLVPAERVPRVVENLVNNIAAHDFHLTTGNICTKYLMEVLAAHGQMDTAWRLATQTTYPSWGYMLSKGATTIWERWEYATGGGMNSHNHPMLGSIGAWLYRHVAGIQLAEGACGSNRFRVRPPLIPDLHQVSVSLDTVNGRLSYAWEQRDGRRNVQLTIPVGTTVRVELPMTPGNAGQVTESGQPLETAEGITDVLITDELLAFTAGSGNYDFIG